MNSITTSSSNSSNGSKPFPSSPQDVVIVSAVRTPLCRAGRKGKFAKTAPSTLLGVVLRGCLQSPHVMELPTTITTTHGSSTNADIQVNRTFIVSPEEVQDICIGNVLGAPSEFVSMRMAQLASDLPFTVPFSVVNRQCSSGLQAIQNIASAIQCGTIQIGIAGGVESMTSYPMMSSSSPQQANDSTSKPTTNTTPPLLADWQTVRQCPDAMDCLIPMGITSENVIQKYSLQRSDLDMFAYHSHRKAHEAQLAGKFVTEIIPVGDISQDDGIRPSTTLEGLSKLPPVFDKVTGMTTAGNSSQLTDGAAAILLMSRREAMKRKLRILGVWRGFSVLGVPPKLMGIGPRYAIPRLIQDLENDKIDLSRIDIFEINEAFASQATWCIKELHIDPQKVNPNGGAIALGHPLGCTGARLVVTLLHELNRSHQHLGIVSMCIGTGMGAAALLEVEHPTANTKQGDYTKLIRSAL